jgi:ABC-type amino acid transport substrate-binding protein
MIGKLQFSAPRILRYCAITVMATALTLFAVAGLLRVTKRKTYDKGHVAMNMQFLHPPAQAATVLDHVEIGQATPAKANTPKLEMIRQSGHLRVGFVVGAMPYSFTNDSGELVGFDIEMAHHLASELGVALDLVPISREDLSEHLEQNLCDVVMSGVIMTTRRASEMEFSEPYMDETIAFVVPDRRRADFSSAEWIRGTKGLRVAVPALPYLTELIHREFPDVTQVEIPFDNHNLNEFFESKGPQVDGLVFTAERGSFRTLVYPAYSVAVPHPVVLKIPLAYAVAKRDVEFARFLSLWIELKKKDGTIQSLYDHWILGRNAQQPKKRWSVLSNVLGVG